MKKQRKPGESEKKNENLKASYNTENKYIKWGDRNQNNITCLYTLHQQN